MHPNAICFVRFTHTPVAYTIGIGYICLRAFRNASAYIMVLAGDDPMPWFKKVRLQAFALLVGAGLTALAIASILSVPAWPVLGVAFAAVAFCVHSMASRLSEPVCLTCGTNLSSEPSGERGVICKSCGTLNDRLAFNDLRALNATKDFGEDSRNA